MASNHRAPTGAPDAGARQAWSGLAAPAPGRGRGGAPVQHTASTKAAADAVRARIGLAMNWKILQVFLAHPDFALTLEGLQHRCHTEYRRQSLNWGLRVLERQAFLRSRRGLGGRRAYWLSNDPAIRAGLALCGAYYG